MDKQFSLSVFVFFDSLVVSVYETRVAMRFPAQKYLEWHLGCHTC